jgi:CheY-like chemotaxis protein
MAKRILIADDSVTIQKAFAMVFGGQDVTLLTARSVEEALSAAKHGRPDLVIADAALGNASGYDLCASLKADAGLRGIPVYILASSHVPYDEGRGQRAGAAGSLVKPFESQSIIDQVTSALAHAPAVSAPAPRAEPPVMRAEPPRPAPMPAPIPQPMPARETDRVDLGASKDDDDDYGEFIVERPGSGSAPAPALARPAPAPMSPPRAAPAPMAPPASLRPSLIPGIRPGAPRETTSRPVAPAASVAPAAASPSPGLHRQVTNRTMMGVPAMGSSAAPPVQARPSAPAPAPAPAAPSTPAFRPSSPFAPSAPVAAAVSNVVAQKMSALAARGPEYEAIAKFSREIIEQVVWEVVPELAEAIIRQEVDRLAAAKR